MSDLIERHLAERRIDEALSGVFTNNSGSIGKQILERIPSAQPKIEERKEESAQNVPKEDLISRKEAIEALRVAYWDDNIQSAKDDPCIVDAMTDWAIRQVKALPSAQPEIKPISYQDCANAMMMMWMDDVLTDGEYRRIMDKLNDHESGKENR